MVQYAFLCPNCGGNNPPANAVSAIDNYLKSNNVQYGQLWYCRLPPWVSLSTEMKLLLFFLAERKFRCPPGSTLSSARGAGTTTRPTLRSSSRPWRRPKGWG
jgi:hypothetical protein